MDDQASKKKYCFDSSVLMMAWRLHYKPKSFSSLWDHLGDMMQAGLIVIPEEVRKEIGAGKDDLILWLKKYKSCIIPIDEPQLKIVAEIVNKYPLVSQYKKPRPNNADPFIVAVAKLDGRTVVTYERSNGQNNPHPRIPDLCKEHEVECCDLPAFFEKEGITFEIKPI
ncbi:MAG: DUF4411 family protein [Candidatus Paceibacterota bacterium]